MSKKKAKEVAEAYNTTRPHFISKITKGKSTVE